MHPLVKSYHDKKANNSSSDKFLAAANAGVKMKTGHYRKWFEYQRKDRTGKELVISMLETYGEETYGEKHPLAMKLVLRGV